MLLVTWANDSKITVTTIINLFPSILSFFTETVTGKGATARALSGIFWISPSASISVDFLLLTCTITAQRGLETLAGLVGCPRHWMLKPLQQSCSQVVSSFDGLQRSQLFQLRITWSTHPAANASSQKLQAFCFVSLFFSIYCISIGVCYCHTLQHDIREQNLSLETALNLNDNSCPIW